MIKQGTPEWFAMRVGKITASRIADVLAKGKNGESLTRAKYKAQIVAERLTGVSQEDGYESEAMRRGTEKEPVARMAYEAETGVFVDQVAFVSVGSFGCSPDGLVGADGGIEIKCPNTATHIRWIADGKVPAEHQKQMMWCMAVTGRKWWDFVSFDDRVPDDLRLFVRRLDYDADLTAEMRKAAHAFDAECEEMLAALKAAA